MDKWDTIQEDVIDQYIYLIESEDVEEDEIDILLKKKGTDASD
jgi:hypothetical protein